MKSETTYQKSEVLVSQAMLFGVRNELKSDIKSVGAEVKTVKTDLKLVKSDLKSLQIQVKKIESKFGSFESKMESRFKTFESKMDSKFEAFELKMDLKFEAFESRIESKFDSRFESLSAQIHRVGVLVEEQNARNAVVLDGIIGLSHRLDPLESQVNLHGKILSGLK